MEYGVAYLARFPSSSCRTALTSSRISSLERTSFHTNTRRTVHPGSNIANQKGAGAGAIRRSPEDMLALVSPADDVIDSSVIFNPNWMNHPNFLSFFLQVFKRDPPPFHFGVC